ncbi:MAG: hypothetical protein O3A00_08385 [Planctomycetota bacterium]|nr:hypothetical protein [Planctomycetota bacterium]
MPRFRVKGLHCTLKRLLLLTSAYISDTWFRNLVECREVEITDTAFKKRTSRELGGLAYGSQIWRIVVVGEFQVDCPKSEMRKPDSSCNEYEAAERQQRSISFAASRPWLVCIELIPLGLLPRLQVTAAAPRTAGRFSFALAWGAALIMRRGRENTLRKPIFAIFRAQGTDIADEPNSSRD